MLRELRANTKWIMLITAAAFVGLMVFEWGMDASGRGLGMRAGEIGRVNGEPVGTQEFLDTYRDMHQRVMAERDAPLSAMDDRMLEEEVWGQMVTRRLIQQELRRRGIRVTSEDIRLAARYAPPRDVMEYEGFHTDGQFDLSLWHNYLASPMVSSDFLLWLEHYYREIIAESRLAQQVMAGAHIPDGALWRLWQDQVETVTFRYVAIDPLRTVPDHEVSITEEEVRAHYRQNRESYRRPGVVTLNYVALDKLPTPADTAATRERVEAIRQDILDGADFAEVARRESADPGSAAAGGELGWFSRGQMVSAFEEAAFSQTVGRIGEPVLTPFGFHLIEVLERQADEADARHILIPVERTPDSEWDLLELADSLEFLAEQRPLAEVAEHLGLGMAGARLYDDETSLPGLGPIDEGARWAFKEASAGEVSPLFDARDYFYMLELVEHVPGYIPTLEEAEEQVYFEIISKKKLERARRNARELVDQLRAGASLDEVAQANRLEVEVAGPVARMGFVPELGSASAVIGTAFGLQNGRPSGVIEADQRLFIVETLERTTADSEEWEQQKEQQRARLLPRIEASRWEQFIDALWETADIVDNRELVLRGDPEASDAGWFRRSLPF